MNYEIRYATVEEYPALAELDGATFGIGYDDTELELGRLELHLDRVLVAVDGTRIVGMSAELPFDMVLPGSEPVPATGLTWVSVDVTHRRRGVLRSLVERQVRDAARSGVAAVILYASEGGIYGRYGFGNATVFRRTVITRRRARLADPVDASAVRRLTTDQARDLLPPVYERWRRTSPGGLSRDAQRWQLMLRDPESARHGASALQHLVHPDGYVSYRVKTAWEQGEPNGDCEIVDYVPGSPEAHAALWQTLLGLDLVARINSYRIPVDDPLPLLLADPRAVDTTHVADGMWVRPADVPALLAGRRYGLEIDCVLEVRDPVLGDGRYRLKGGPDGAACRPTDAPADVVLGVAEVGSLVLGGTRLRRLVRAGQAGCPDAALLHRLDLALLADRDPFAGTQF
jgi:predicted acetyltransferase